MGSAECGKERHGQYVMEWRRGGLGLEMGVMYKLS